MPGLSSTASRRAFLVELLRREGIRDERVLKVMGEIPRECFVLADLVDQAYDNSALPIEAGQTISQPSMVALMTAELRLEGPETVLEIGTGSGYQAAILSHLCQRVVSIERIPELSERAGEVLRRLGCQNVELVVGDGTLGVPNSGPYDGILVTAGAPDFPHTLFQQLREGGRLVIPVGEGFQMLQTIRKVDGQPRIENVCECRFVPLIGAEGYPDERDRQGLPKAPRSQMGPGPLSPGPPSPGPPSPGPTTPHRPGTRPTNSTE
jgi:protein-L-isoaspartate(D-aspartate) O-methyltransferase